ncbi:DUF418 domain-containing protein [Bacillus sp. OK048]|uniref:DUF418 domain-containing protein n=1 Tax=Bacillus sp. OK048 TaxID=1882761 RepID=UPI00087DF681|nr:DUF418 domain-containing protein [Bacillus sp. OK048]SDN24201.1 Uncharacterized membrane protein YeiB [Bacillus sp. OK048]
MKLTESTNRIDILDYLRGFALLGIILVNILSLLAVKLPDLGSVDAAYQRFLFLFVEGRFYTLFSFLFGVGFYLFISRANAKGKNGYGLFLRRIAVLFILGWFHVTFHPGEALTVYAVTGLLLLPFYKVKKEINLGIGLLLLVGLSIMAFKLFMVVPLMLLGITAGQYRLFEGLSGKLKKAAIFTGIMFLLSLVGIINQFQHIPAQPFGFFEGGVDEQTYQFLSIGITIGPAVSALYVGLLILLLQFPFVQKLLSPLKSYGRMALTNYIFQTVFIYLAGYAFNLFGSISYLQSLAVCISIYVIQLVFSVIWLRYFQFGPLEWIWRGLTYLELPPMRKRIKIENEYAKK